MNINENNLNVLSRVQKTQIIVLLKQCIHIIISSTNLKFKFFYTHQYRTVIKQLIEIAASQTGITDPRIIKYFLYFILKHTNRGYLFPPTFKALLLEIIQILAHTCISYPNETSV